MKSLRVLMSTTGYRLTKDVKRIAFAQFNAQRRMLTEGNVSFSNGAKLKFPWEEDNELLWITLSKSESFFAKIVRKLFFFLEADGLNEKEFFEGALTAYKASSDSIFEYCREVQQLIQQDPSSLKSLTTHPSLEQGRERLKTVLDSSLGEHLLSTIHQYYQANPSAEVVYEREEEKEEELNSAIHFGMKDKSESKQGISVTIKLIPKPNILIRKSRFAMYNFPSKSERANKTFIDWMKRLYPVEYKSYEQLIQKNDPENTVSLEVRAMLVIVQIPSRELFYIKDRLTGTILQGSTESHFKTHTINLEFSNLKGKIGEEAIDKQGSWSVRDIDMINAARRFHNNLFETIRQRNWK